jgi:two-component system, NarL family, sensor histidine kinase UhpB
MNWLPKALDPGELRLSVRTSVIAIVAVVLIPALLIAGLLAALSARSERAELERSAHRQADEVRIAIDREIVGTQNVLSALATSPFLQNGDLEGFHRQAMEVTQRTDVQIVLRDLDVNRQVINTFYPYGAALDAAMPPPRSEQGWQEIRDGKPNVSNVYFGPLIKRPIVAVTVPVVRDGSVHLVLSSGIRLDRFGAILSGLNIRPDQIATVIDRGNSIVARSQKHDEIAGTHTTFDVPNPLPTVLRGKNREGIAVHWFNERSDITGWTIVISIPDSVLDASSKFAVASFSVAGGLLLFVGIWLAYGLGGRVSRSVGQLSAALAASEDQRLFAIEAAEVGTWHWDAVTKQYTWSDSLRRILGIPAEIPASRDAVRVRVHPTDWIMIEEILRRSNAGESHFEMDFRVLPTPGVAGQRWIRAKGRVDRDETGKTTDIRGIVQDVTAHKAAEAERDALRRSYIQAQEEERLRLAHELHDQTGQSLTAALLELKGIEKQTNESDRKRIRLLRWQLEQMGRTLHHIAWELRPASIDEVGLAGALSNYLSEWSAQFGIETDFHCDDTGIDALPDYSRTSIYRIVQECLTNIAKHAVGATLVSVVMERHDGVLQVMIEDNGSGFDIGAKGLGAKLAPEDKRPGLGLPGMNERLALIGGSLEIESSIGGGTTVFVRVPIQLESTAALT